MTGHIQTVKFLRIGTNKTKGDNPYNNTMEKINIMSNKKEVEHIIAGLDFVKSVILIKRNEQPGQWDIFIETNHIDAEPHIVLQIVKNQESLIPVTEKWNLIFFEPRTVSSGISCCSYDFKNYR